MPLYEPGKRNSQLNTHTQSFAPGTKVWPERIPGASAEVDNRHEGAQAADSTQLSNSLTIKAVQPTEVMQVHSRTNL